MKERFHKPKQVNHQRGFSMTESLVAATMLLAMTNLSANFFTKSSDQFQQASLRDSVNALIEQDLEAIRSQVAQWHANQDPGSGQISYAPPEAACTSRNLASALLSDSSVDLDNSYELDLSKTTLPAQGLSINATLQANESNGNLLQVSYQSNANGPFHLSKQAQLLPPAQGWCP